MSLVIFDNFTSVLQAQKIPENQLPYFHNWVDCFKTHCKTNNLSFFEKDSLQPFIYSLEKTNKPQWQRKQAYQAVLLFFDTQKNCTTTDPKSENEQQKISNIPHEYSKPELKNSWSLLYDKVTKAIKVKHLSDLTLKHYTGWIRQFQKFCSDKDPSQLNQSDVRIFLEHLAIDRQISASSQNQAFNALLFLFRNVLDLPFEGLQSTVRAKEAKRIPTVLSQNEIKGLFSYLRNPYLLIAQLMYGCGLRLTECLSLRIQNINFDQKQLFVSQGKGKKDRIIPLPQTVIEPLKVQIQSVQAQYKSDLCNIHYDGVFLPLTIERKGSQFGKAFGWYWLFPSRELTFLPESKKYKRYYLHQTAFQKAYLDAKRKACITRYINAHTLRHTFATHLLQAGYDIRQVQDLLGHTDVRTTMIYTHVVRPDMKQIQSPLDLLLKDKYVNHNLNSSGK